MPTTRFLPWMIAGCLAVGGSAVMFAQTEPGIPPAVSVTEKPGLPPPAYPECPPAARESIEKQIQQLYELSWDSEKRGGVISTMQKNARVEWLAPLAEAAENAPYKVRHALCEVWMKLMENLPDARGMMTSQAVAFLGDDNWRVRQHVLQCLSKMGETSTAAWWVDALRDPVWSVRRAAAKALAGVRDPRLAEIVYGCLQAETEPDVQLEMVSLLGDYAYAPARDLFHAYLGGQHVVLSIKSFSALTVIDGVNDPRLTEALPRMIAHYDVATPAEMGELKKAMKTAAGAARAPLLAKFRTARESAVIQALKDTLKEKELLDETVEAQAIAMLRQDAETARLDACVEILKAGDEERVFPRLREFFDDKGASATARQRAVDVIGGFKGDGARLFLADLLALPDAQCDRTLKSRIMESIKLAPNPMYLRSLREAILKDGNAEFRARALDAYLKCAKDDAATLAPVLELFAELQDDALRNAIAQALKIRASEAPYRPHRDTLIAFFCDALSLRGEIPKTAVDGLRNLKAVEKRAELIALASDRNKDPELRVALVTLLSRDPFLDESCRPLLETVYQNFSDPDAKAAAIDGLARFPDRNLWNNFLKQLQIESDNKILGKLTEVIARMAGDNPEWRQDLYPLLAHKNEGVRRTVLDTLAKMKPQESGAVPALHQYLAGETHDRWRATALQMLSGLADPASEDIFVDVLKNSNDEAGRRAAVEYIGKAGISTAVDLIHQELARDRSDKSACIETLGKLRQPASLPLLGAQLATASNASQILKALGQFRAPEADRIIVDHLRAKHPVDAFDHPAQAALAIADELKSVCDDRFELQIVQYDEVLNSPSGGDDCGVIAASRKADILDAMDRRDEALQLRLNAYENATRLALDKIEATDRRKWVWQAYVRRVEPLLTPERVGEAIPIIEAYLRDNDNGRAYNSAAYLLADRGLALDTAVAWATTAVEKEPALPFIADTLAWALYRAERYPEALEASRKAIALDIPDAKRARRDLRVHLAIIQAALRMAPELRETIAWFTAGDFQHVREILKQPTVAALRAEQPDFDAWCAARCRELGFADPKEQP